MIDETITSEQLTKRYNLKIVAVTKTDLSKLLHDTSPL